ncbi:hypothetical protein BKA82DRAFT_4056625 [Pisolithus tinctorius]|nr:hypothetical protein BKA82DRAFT_4056625 [Pisolithus tinctorius]
MISFFYLFLLFSHFFVLLLCFVIRRPGHISTLPYGLFTYLPVTSFSEWKPKFCLKYFTTPTTIMPNCYHDLLFMREEYGCALY